MSLDKLFDQFSNRGDTEVRRVVTAMMQQLSGNHVTRLKTLASYINVLQALLDPMEEKEALSESTRDFVRQHLEALREHYEGDLKRLRDELVGCRNQFTRSGCVSEAESARGAVERVQEMLDAQRVNQEALVEIIEQYDSLMSRLHFGGVSE